jgi:hypothetical protein
MNSTFKITSATDQLDIIQYTVPPPAKPRRPQAPRQQEVMLEKCSLPNLIPNSLFDEPSESASHFESSRSKLADSRGSGYEILDPSTSDANLLEVEFTGENLF